MEIIKTENINHKNILEYTCVYYRYNTWKQGDELTTVTQDKSGYQHLSCDKVGFWIYFEDRLIEFLDMLDTGEERNREGKHN